MLELLLLHLHNYIKLNNCKLFRLQRAVFANEAKLKRRRSSANSNFPSFLRMQVFNNHLCSRRIFTAREF